MRPYLMIDALIFDYIGVLQGAASLAEIKLGFKRSRKIFLGIGDALLKGISFGKIAGYGR